MGGGLVGNRETPVTIWFAGAARVGPLILRFFFRFFVAFVSVVIVFGEIRVLGLVEECTEFRDLLANGFCLSGIPLARS